MMMKKGNIIIIAMFLLAFCMKSNAQSFSVKSGLNLSFLYYEQDVWGEMQKLKPGFHIGSTFETPISKSIFFEPELLLTSNGVMIFEEEGASYFKYSENLYYLNITFKGKSKYDLGKMKINTFLGPYAGLALIGKAKMELCVDGIIESSGSVDIELGSDGDRKRSDLGLTLGAGLEYKPFLFEAAFDYGLENISTASQKIKNRVLRFTLGYRLN